MSNLESAPGRLYIGEPLEEWRSREVEDRAAQQIIYTITRSADTFQNLRSNFDTFFDSYVNKPVNLRNTNRLRSNVPSGLASEIVDTFHADIMTKIYRSRPLVMIDRRTTNPDEARASEELLQYNFDMMPLWDPLDSIVLSAEIYGVGAGKLCWEERNVNVPVRGVTGRGRKPQFEAMKAYRGPVLESKFLYDVYPDPNKVLIDDRYPVADISWADFSELERLEDAGVYHNVGDIPELGDLKTYDKGTYSALLTVFGDRIYQSEQRSKLGFANDSRTQPDGVFVIEWEGFFRPEIDWVGADGREHKGYEPIRSILTMANGVVIRAEPSPFRSGENAWIWARIGRVPGQLYGMGLIQKSKPQVHIVNVALNMALQNLAQTVNRMKVVRPDLIQSTMSLDEQPGGLVELKRGATPDQAIREIVSQPLGMDVYRLIGMGTERAQGVSGASALKMGNVATGDNTATESNLAYTNASQKFQYAMHWIDQTVIIPTARKSHQLNQQFLDQEFVMMILGPDGKYFETNVSPVQLAANPNFVAMASTKADNVQMAIAQYQSAIRIMTAMQFPWVEPVLKKITMQLFEEWRFPGMEELKQLMEEAQQAALAAPPAMGPDGNPLPSAPTAIPGMSGGAPAGRVAAPAGTGRQDRRVGTPTNMQQLAKSLGGMLGNQGVAK